MKPDTRQRYGYRNWGSRSSCWSLVPLLEVSSIAAQGRQFLIGVLTPGRRLQFRRWRVPRGIAQLGYQEGTSRSQTPIRNCVPGLRCLITSTEDEATSKTTETPVADSHIAALCPVSSWSPIQRCTAREVNCCVHSCDAAV